MRGRRAFLLFAVFSVVLVAVGDTVHAQRFEAADEAEASGRHILQLSLTPLYQYAVDSGEDTGSYELDLSGSLRILGGQSGAGGDGRIVFWTRLRDNLGGLQPTSEMAARSGLLWPTNDVVVTDRGASVPLLAWAQRFTDNRCRFWAGKIWPQLFFVQQKLAGDNPEGFMSRLISNDMAARYYDLAGLGAFAEYSGRKFFVKGSFVDAQADTEFDLSSFVEGRWAWIAEGGWRSRRSAGTTSLSVLVSTVSDTDDVDGETAHSLAFSHDLARSVHTIFGRYTYRGGGAPLTEKGVELAKPLDRSAFVAWAWNRPFGSEDQQLAAAIQYGEPIEFTDALGFDIQYGLEVFWKIRVGNWLEITPDLQLIRSLDGGFEAVPGVRLRVFKAFVF
jgi:hypothetical protein